MPESPNPGQSYEAWIESKAGASPPEPCAHCGGHGDIWTSWHPTPVTCGHCHGTGQADDHEPPLGARCN